MIFLPNTPEKSSDNKISIFTDKPLLNKEQDFFERKYIANTVINIINDLDNDEHVNIAIYGPWGTGKSSIGNFIKQEVKNLGHEYVYLSVWKYAGETDSLVRKFLLKASEDIEGIKDRNENQISQELYQTKSMSEGIKPLLWWKEFAKYILLVFLPLVIVLSAINWAICYLNINKTIFNNLVSVLSIPTAGITIIGAIIIAYFKQIIGLSDIKITKTESPKSSKEQYETLFKDLIAKVNKDKRIIFFIDDLDRLSYKKVIEVLETIKTFVENKRCIFIVACEESILLQAIKFTYNKVQNQNQEEEGDEKSADCLEKIFQISIHLPLLYETNLIEYAESLIKQHNNYIPYSELNDSDVELIKVALIHSRIKTPRQVKIQLNDFSAVYYIAYERQIRYITSNTPFLAKIIAIRNEWPEFYKIVERHSYLLDELRDCGSQEFMDKIKNFGLNTVKVQGLYSYLIRTKSIIVNNGIEPFIFLQETPANNEKVGGLEDRLRIKQAAQDGNGNFLIEFLKTHKDREDELCKFILELCEIGSPVLQTNAKKSFSNLLATLEDQTIKRNVTKISFSLFEPETFKNLANEYNLKGLFRLISSLDNNYASKIIDHYIKDWGSLIANYSLSFGLIDNFSYVNQRIQKIIIENLNKQLFDWKGNYEELKCFISIIKEVRPEVINNLTKEIWAIISELIKKYDDEGEPEIIEEEDLEERSIEIKYPFQDSIFLMLSEFWERVYFSSQSWRKICDILEQDYCRESIIEKLIITKTSYIASLDKQTINNLIETLLNSDYAKLSKETQVMVFDKLIEDFPEVYIFEKQNKVFQALCILLCSNETRISISNNLEKYKKLITRFEHEEAEKALDYVDKHLQHLKLNNECLAEYKSILDLLMEFVNTSNYKQIATLLIDAANRLNDIEIQGELKNIITGLVCVLIKNLYKLVSTDKVLAREIADKWKLNKIQFNDEISAEAIKLYMINGRDNFFTGMVLAKAMEYSAESFLLGLEYFDVVYPLYSESEKAELYIKDALKGWVEAYSLWLSNKEIKPQIDSLSQRIIDKHFHNMKRFIREVLKLVPELQDKIDILVQNIGGEAHRFGARKILYGDVKKDAKANPNKLDESLKILIGLNKGDYQQDEIFNVFKTLLKSNLNIDNLLIVLSNFKLLYETKDNIPRGQLGTVDDLLKKIISQTKTNENIKGNYKLIEIIQEILVRLERSSELKEKADKVKTKIEVAMTVE